MRFISTPLAGSYLIDLEKKEDDRGFFSRYYCESEYSDLGLNTRWVQINNSFSKDVGTIRGLHFQRPPHAEVKVIRCLQGAVWDVIVDLRDGSTTYGKWFGAELSAANRAMMYVPRGFAHGFITLEPNVEILYLVSDYYEPSAEGILLWSDPDIGIAWPIEPTVLSDKDRDGINLLNLGPIIDLI